MEVDFNATVAGRPHFFFGSHTRCEHESFRVHTNFGSVEVIDNVSIAPRIPVQPGDRIEVRGDLVRTRDGHRIVHWTHHDPQGRHTPGFIRFDGRTYA